MTRAAAAFALALAVTTLACGEKDERIVGPSRADVQALTGAGLAAVGLEGSVAGFRATGRTLRIRLASPVAGGPLGRLLGSFEGARAEIRQFCPKPALLRCRPAFRAWATPASLAAERRSVAALRRLARRTYGARPLLVRRRGRTTHIVTANGELLAAVSRAGPELTLSFGGLDPPQRPTDPAAGRLEVVVAAPALTAIARDLPPRARQALAGVRRLVVSSRL